MKIKIENKYKNRNISDKGNFYLPEIQKATKTNWDSFILI